VCTATCLWGTSGADTVWFACSWIRKGIFIVHMQFSRRMPQRTLMFLQIVCLTVITDTGFNCFHGGNLCPSWCCVFACYLMHWMVTWLAVTAMFISTLRSQCYGE
jgi:hypothetical protein